MMEATRDEASTPLYFRLDPTHTNYINRILEGYEYVGVMSTVDRVRGIAMVRTTADTKPLAREILRSLPEVGAMADTLDVLMCEEA